MNINATSYALVTITMDEVGLYTLINAVISAIQHAEDWNFDDEYDIEDLRKMIRLKDYYDLIITFRYVK